MKSKISRFLTTLVALFAMTTGAWADDGTLLTTINASADFTSGEKTFDDIVTVTFDNGVYYSADNGWYFTSSISTISMTVTPVDGVTVLGYTVYFNNSNHCEIEGSSFTVYLGNYEVYADNQTTKLGIQGITKIEVYGTAAPAGTALTPDDTRKVWTLDAMPAGNVELQVAYFPGMLTLAKAEGGSIAVDGLSLGQPKALDVPAAWSEDETMFSANDLPTDFAAIDDADLPATIAALSSDPLAFLIYGFDGEKTKVVSYVNGTKDYTDAGFVKRYDVPGWIEGGYKGYYTATTLPAGFDTDGTNIYVEPKTEFKVKATPAEGYRLVKLTAGETDITTKVDADGIATVTMPDDDADLTLTATFSDEYELTFAAANANTIESGKASVTVDGTAATPTEGKLSVKAGQKVKITTTGPDYIIRKAEVKKDGVAGPEVTETKDDADNVIAAEFDMPSYDATLEYDIVRNLASNMTVTVGDGTEGYRIRVKKDGNGYVPAELTIQEILALIKVHDDTEQKDLTIVTDFTAAIYAVDDNGQKTGDAITFANLTPGSYVVTATAPETSELYGGTTPQSNIFELYAQYDIAFTAGNDYALDGTTASITKQEGQNEAVDVTENIDENGLLEDVKPEATVTVTAAEGYVISAFTATLPESTENFASINADKTAAQFAMPESNVNVDYTFLRNMAVNMDVTVGDGKDGYRLRIKKEGESFVPAEMTFEEMLALYAVTDNIESQNLVFFGQGKNCDISIFAVDDDDQPTGDAIDFTALTPGRYVAIASAAEGSVYYGETEQSNIFELYQGYEVEIAGGEYITYFKDEAIYVEDPEAALYTITAIGEGTATATQFDVIPANTPMLVKNNSAEKRTILLIPTENAPANFTYYDGFVGTLEATTILASDATADRYAFNGKQFVWVKKDLAVGANKAWLELSKDASNARIINIFFEETTGIDEMVNGQWSMVNGTWYDLNGRKLDTIPTKKGVYIFNGKKVVVK